MGCRCAHWFKAWHLPCVRQYPAHDVVPPSSLEGCPQMHQTTNRCFRPERPWGLETGALVKRGGSTLPAFGTLGTFGACHVPGPLPTDGLPLCSLVQSLASAMCPSIPRS